MKVADRKRAEIKEGELSVSEKTKFRKMAKEIDQR